MSYTHGEYNRRVTRSEQSNTTGRPLEWGTDSTLCTPENIYTVLYKPNRQCKCLWMEWEDMITSREGVWR
jgi:hypothetical protein